ncbi:MAG: UDP-2,4-diacetamido-2,4,6-trideoxy-beta-L-altropyranose hydrolase [Nitrospirota bacterium]
MNKTVCIRVDGSVEIGTGHIIRCLSLADELSVKGYKTIFCTREFEQGLVKKILDRGYKVSVIDVDATLEEDKKHLINFAKSHNTKIIITDNYHFRNNYLRGLKENFKVLVSIDDIGDTFFYSDILINQNINATPEMYDGKTKNGTKLLLGPTYAMLRPEFKKYHNQPRESGKVKNILVTLGGGDPENQTLKVLKALEMVRGDFSVTTVIGVSNRNRAIIRDYVATVRKDIKLLENVSDMAELMREADIAIGAGGSTSWEFCCLGIPMIVIFFADNQRGIAEGLYERGIAINLGYYKYISENDIKVAVENLINNPYKREIMSLKGKEIVDGKGAERVVGEIIRRIKD